MQHFIPNIMRGLALVAVIGGGALQASAAEVRVGVSSKDTYVGMPVYLQIQVSNASSVEPPVIPDVDGLDIRSRGTPSQSTQITTINGRTTRNTSLTYVYEVVPQRAGSFRIPPISVEVDGAEQQTRAIQFVASKSETGDLLFVEVAGKEKEIYVGQALDLTLKIWVRPFRDAERDITLSAGDMWQLVSSRSSWGMFNERIEEMAANRRRPKAQEVLRKDRDGVEHSYYLYEIDATIYPKYSGKIDADDVHVIVEYPTELGTSRDPFESMFDDMPMPRGFGSMFGGDDFPSPFGRRLTVKSVRPLVADASVESIEVLSIPTAGRPADYRGAVGNYQIVTDARQTDVKAGDPIELLIGIVGTGPMELVQAPPLAELPELTAEFKVPSEPLAGFVQDDRKVFSTTIRPREQGIKAIPAIPFTFFDPQQKQFITVHSDPISIHVEPADTLALDAIVGSRAAAGHGAGPTSAAEAAPSFQNYTGDDLLSSESPAELGTATLVFLIALPPLVVLGLWVARDRTSISRLLGQLGFGSNRAQARIKNAKTAEEVCLAMQAYLAGRLALKTDSKDSAAVIGALRAAGQHKLAVRCERVFQTVQQARASKIHRPVPLQEVQHEALEVLAELQQHHEQKRSRPTRWQHSPADFRGAGKKTTRVASLLMLAGALALSSSVASADTGSQPMPPTTPSTSVETHSTGYSADVLLTTEQQRAILAEANQLYTNSLDSTSNDSADSKQAFADAAEKYQLLVDSGIANSRLYVNLANAYLQSGQRGKAIANYKRALEIDPTIHMAQINLEHAVQSIAPADTEDSADSGVGFHEFTVTVNQWLAQRFSQQLIAAVAFASWCALWLAVALRLYHLRFPWKTAVATAVIVALASTSLYVANWETGDQTIAVVTSPSAVLRQGDGDNFPAAGVKLSEGESVEVVKQRGDWIKVRLESGQTGWVAPRSVEVI